MQIYIGIGLFLAIIAAVIMTALKGEQTQKVTLDDVADEKPRKRAGLKRPAGAAEQSPTSPSQSAASTEPEWEKCEIDQEGLQKELDTEGPFAKTITGSLEPEAMLKLKRVIGKFSYLAFLDCKEKMMEERIGYLKNNKEKEYQQMIMKAAQKFGKLQFEVTKMAAEFIDLDEVNFEASMKEAVKDEAIVKQMKEDDENVRMRCEKPRPNAALSKEKAKEIVIQKIKMEFETEKKMSSL